MPCKLSPHYWYSVDECETVLNNYEHICSHIQEVQNQLPSVVVLYKLYQFQFQLYLSCIMGNDNCFQMVILNNFRTPWHTVLTRLSNSLPNTMYETPYSKRTKFVHYKTNIHTVPLRCTVVKVGICLATARHRKFSYLIRAIAAVTLLCHAGISHTHRHFNGGLSNFPFKLF